MTWYHPAYLRGQQGSGVTEELIKIASPVLLHSLQSGLHGAASGKSLGLAGQVIGQSLKQGSKQKAGSILKAGIKAVGQHAYKKAKRSVASIFGTTCLESTSVWSCRQYNRDRPSMSVPWLAGYRCIRTFAQSIGTTMTTM